MWNISKKTKTNFRITVFRCLKLCKGILSLEVFVFFEGSTTMDVIFEGLLSLSARDETSGNGEATVGSRVLLDGSFSPL